MLDTWTAAVLGEMNNRSASCPFVSPAAVASDRVTLPGRREGHVGRDREGVAVLTTGVQPTKADLGDG